MSQNKEQLVAELKELTNELEEMGNYFNRDGVIDAQEQALLDELKNEIKFIKTEITELNSSHAVKEIVKKKSEKEEPKTEIQIGMEEGTPQANTTTVVTVDSDGKVALDMKTKEGGDQTELHLDSDGNVSVTETTDLGNDASMKLMLSNKGIQAGFEKKFELLKAETKAVPLASYGVISAKLKATVGAELVVGVTEELTTDKIGFGAYGNFKMTGKVELFLSIAEVLESGFDPGLELTLDAKGEIYVDVKNQGVILDLGGVEGKVDATVGFFVRASAPIVEVYKAFGGDPKDLEYTVELGRLNLLKFNTPKYKTDLLSPAAPTLTDFNFREGDDIKSIVDKVKAIGDKIGVLIDTIKEVGEWIADLGSGAAEAIKDYGDWLEDAYFNGAASKRKSKEQQKRWAEEAATIIAKAMKKAATKKAVLDQLVGLTGKDLKMKLREIVEKDPAINGLKVRISNGDFEEMLNTIDANVVVAITSEKNEYNYGSNVRGKIQIQTNKELGEAGIKIAIYCDGTQVGKETTLIVRNFDNTYECEYSLYLPEDDWTTKTDGKWEIIATYAPKSDFLSEKGIKKITVKKPDEGEMTEKNEIEHQEDTLLGTLLPIDYKVELSSERNAINEELDVVLRVTSPMDVTIELNLDVYIGERLRRNEKVLTVPVKLEISAGKELTYNAKNLKLSDSFIDKLEFSSISPRFGSDDWKIEYDAEIRAIFTGIKFKSEIEGMAYKKAWGDFPSWKEVAGAEFIYFVPK